MACNSHEILFQFAREIVLKLLTKISFRRHFYRYGAKSLRSFSLQRHQMSIYIYAHWKWVTEKLRFAHKESLRSFVCRDYDYDANENIVSLSWKYRFDVTLIILIRCSLNVVQPTESKHWSRAEKYLGSSIFHSAQHLHQETNRLSEKTQIQARHYYYCSFLLDWSRHK